MDISMAHPESNEEWWAVMGRAAADTAARALQDVEKERNRFSSLEYCAWSHLGEAFRLMAVEEYALATTLLTVTVEDAELALASGSFERMFVRKHSEVVDGVMQVYEDTSFRPSKRQLRIQEESGRMYCHKALYYAYWLRDNQRHSTLWQRALESQSIVYDLYWRKPFNGDACQDLMMDYILGSEYDQAVEIYQRDYRKAMKELPQAPVRIRNGLDVLFLMATYCQGAQQLHDIVRDGVDCRYTRCLNWYTVSWFIPQWTKLGWACLHDRIHERDSDINTIIHNLRGY